MMGRTTRSFSFDNARDADLLAWLDDQENASQAVRDALRAAMAGVTGVTLDEVYEAVRALEQKIGTAPLALPVERGEGDAPGTSAAAENLSRLGL